MTFHLLGKKRKLIIIVAFCLLVFVLYNRNDQSVRKLLNYTKAQSQRVSRARYDVTAEKDKEAHGHACKVPILDPYHPQVFSLIENLGTDVRKICSNYKHSPYFELVNNTFVLRAGIDEKRILKESIKLKEIVRISDNSISYKVLEDPFHGKQSIHQSSDVGNSDFIRLDYEIDGEKVSDLHARVVSQVDVLKNQMEAMKTFMNKGIPTNVLIIGFESTSRANFERKMSRFVSLLKTQLNTYFMDGMSIVGDATTPAVAAVLTGKKLADLPEGKRSRGGTHIDKWPWIMKEYEKQGYMTMFAEDDPNLAAFNLRLEGFKESPTHHYVRPFWNSFEKEHEGREKDLCYKTESTTNITLKYLLDFFDVYPTARKFAFGYLCYTTHNAPNRLSYLEDDLLWFLRAFISKGYHEDTTVIIMGDHGSRNSDFRDTMQGKLEERLPMFSISLPSFFHRRFADLVANLRSNQPMITSQFDVHTTLRHILTYPDIPSGIYSKSLFEELPRSRTCEDAGIAEHFCVCLNWSPINITSKEVQKIAIAVVDYINSELSKIPEVETKCHPLKLDTILSTHKLQVNSMIFQEEKTSGDPRYQIILKTQPNNGKYEATVSVSANESVRVNPEISRINRYNDQPKCIATKYPNYRKFCFCRNQ